MQLFTWLRERMTGRSQTRSTPARKSNFGFRPELETLECRDVPSTLTVTNNLDSGAGSLRAEITAAKKNDTIVFAPTLAGKTITLTSGELDINKNLTIQGPGAGLLKVSGGNASRVFEVDGAKTTATLSGLTITQGNGMAGTNYDGKGGGVLNFGTLTISDCDLYANSASLSGGGVDNRGTLTVSGGHVDSNNARGGGGIASVGTLTVSNCILSGNAAYNQGSGGAISSDGAATISGCTLLGNSAAYGGAIFGGGKLMSVSNCTLSGNSAECYGGAVFDAGKATLSGCTLSGNSAGVDGGGIYIVDHDGKLTLSDSIFSSNSPDNIAGGKYTNGGGNTFK